MRIPGVETDAADGILVTGELGYRSRDESVLVQDYWYGSPDVHVGYNITWTRMYKPYVKEYVPNTRTICRNCGYYRIPLPAEAGSLLLEISMTKKLCPHCGGELGRVDTVWICRVDHRHGTNIYVGQTYDAACSQLYEYVCDYWRECADLEDDWSENPPEEQDKAIEQYFDCRAAHPIAGEWYDIELIQAQVDSRRTRKA